ncbi:hypothetical protein BDP27DRAFT_1064487 [Rhodocollybia butyracea]|uniref:Uncharacterized protein n=1 Tax=Rhodocollybia butyracea TaxID=206335 RepID=A0A9P5PNY5_9AGAR|nr:hypothetical protein BDP27DRAFT_1064487 [Rhodocollybia butyracea]
MRVAMSRIIRGGFGASRIKTGSREPQWVIDRPVEANHELERLSNASSRRSTGHVRLSSSSDNLDFVKPQKGTWSMPGKNLWKNSPLARRIGRTAILPWKSAPASVKPVMPSRRFEIDASSERTRTDSTLENYRRGGFRLWGSRTETTDSVFLTSPIFEYHEAGQTIFEEDEEENDSDLDLGGMNLGDDVMIISETGDNFTIDSPSTSSPSHRIPPSPVRPRSDSPVQRIPPPPRTPDRSSKASRRAPPAPSYPAPTPPPVPSRPHSSRSLPRKMLNKPSNESMPSTATPPSRSPPQKRNLPLLPVPDSTASSAYPSRPLNDSPVPTPVPLPPPPTSPPIVANTQYPASSHPTSRPRPPIPQRPHKHNPSNSTESFPFISSPPYRSSPLPEEVRIARSGSPPPPPSNPSSPGYNITTFASRMGGGFNQIPPMPSSPPYNTTTLPSSRLAGGVSHKPPSSPPYNTTTFSSRLASGVSRTPPVPSSPPYNTTTLPSSRLAVGGSRTPPMPSSPPYNTTNLPSSRLGSSVSRTPPVPSSPPYNTMTLPSSRLGGGVTRTPPLSPPYNTATLSSSRLGGGVSHTPPAPALTSPMQHHRLMSLPTHGYTGGDPGLPDSGLQTAELLLPAPLKVGSQTIVGILSKRRSLRQRIFVVFLRIVLGAGASTIAT